MWELAAGHYDYRPLFRVEDEDGPLMEGWDVYALQSALAGVGADVGVDGVFGDSTAVAVWGYQDDRSLVEDGIAGIETQRDLSLLLARKFRKKYGLPVGFPRGHIEKESSFQLGNHTAPYVGGTAAGSRDLGIVQCNTRYYEIADAFNAMKSLDTLCRRLVDRQEAYAPFNLGRKRTWQLAAGSWNAPAYTNWLAGIRDDSAREPGPAARAAIEAYMQAATAYYR